MELQYHGANAVRITTKKSQLVIDPSSDIASLSSDLKKATIVAVTQQQFSSSGKTEAFLIDTPGEYEFEDTSIKGVAVQSATAPSGDLSSIMYRIIHQDTTILVVGHANEKDAESHLEDIGVVDILVVPIGGGGYTLDSVGAANIVRSVEPKVVVPVHYNDGLAYEVPQQELEQFTKELSALIAEDQSDKYKVKHLPEQLTVQVIKRS